MSRVTASGRPSLSRTSASSASSGARLAPTIAQKVPVLGGGAFGLAGERPRAGARRRGGGDPRGRRGSASDRAAPSVPRGAPAFGARSPPPGRESRSAGGLSRNDHGGVSRTYRRAPLARELCRLSRLHGAKSGSFLQSAQSIEARAQRRRGSVTELLRKRGTGSQPPSWRGSIISRNQTLMS